MFRSSGSSSCRLLIDPESLSRGPLTGKPAQSRISARRPPPARSWTTRLSVGRSPGGSPVAVTASTSPRMERITSTARAKAAGEVAIGSPGVRLVTQFAECPEALVGECPTQGLDARMQPGREVGHDHRAGLRPAHRDLVIGFGIRSRRVQADRGESRGRGPPQRLGPELRLAADHRGVDGRHGQGVVEVAAWGHVDQVRNAGVDRDHTMGFVPVDRPGPRPLIRPVSQDHEVHRSRSVDKGGVMDRRSNHHSGSKRARTPRIMVRLRGERRRTAGETGW